MIVSLTNLAIGIAWLAALVITLDLSRLDWRRDRTSRHVMLFQLVMLAITTLALIAVLFGRDWEGRDPFRFAAWTLIAGVLVHRIYVRYREQREAKK